MNALHLTTVLLVAAALASIARATSDGGGQWLNYPNMDPAMSAACQDANPARVTALLAQHRADLPAYVDARGPSGDTALHRAAGTHYPAEYKRTEVVAALLAAGADPDAQDEGGQTPLHLAAYHGRLNVARALVAGGPDLALATQWNLQTQPPPALQLALLFHRTEVAQYLLNGAPADRATFQAAREKQAFSARTREALAPTVASKRLDGPGPGAALLRETAINGITFLLETARRELWGDEHAPDAAPAIRQKMATYYLTAVAKLQAKLDQLNKTATKEGAGADLARDADTKAKAGGGK